MKKSILAIAVAATMAAPAVVSAAPTVYGNVHLTINAADNDLNKAPFDPNVPVGPGNPLPQGADNNLQMSSNTSAIGVKGSEDLGDGMKAIYKVEFQVNLLPKYSTKPDTNGIGASAGFGGLAGRDQFVGLKGGMGTIKFGTMSSNYKQMGGKVDPLYRTPLEGRGFLGTQSGTLHGGKGLNRGRQTSTVQYVSPKMGGIQLVANTTFSGANDETTGVGVRWSSKSILVYADWIDGQAPGAGILTCDNTVPCASEAAYKVGGKFKTKAFSVAAQYEDTEDRTGSAAALTKGVGGMKHLFLAGTFNINKNNQIALTYGMTDVKVAAAAKSADYTGVAVAYNHKLSKKTNVYVGYGAKSSDADFDQTTNTGGDESMFTVGIKKKF